MWPPPRRAARPARWLAALLLFAAAPVVARAQGAGLLPQRPGEIRGNGTELFRAILHEAKVRPLSLHDFLTRQTRSDTILVIVGPYQRGPNLGNFGLNGLEYAGDVLRAGGAVLFASDTEINVGGWVPGNPWLLVHSHRVHAADPAYQHKPNDPQSVVVMTPEPGRNTGPAAEVFRGLRRVVTEHPSCLVVGNLGPPARERLAWFPPTSYFVAVPNPDRMLQHPDHPPTPSQNPFAVGGAGPDFVVPRAYRFLAMAEHAPLLNKLLIDPTADNLEMAQRLVRFLQDPERVNRTRCLFVENGRVVEQFDTAYRYAVPPPPIPPIQLPPWDKIERAAVDTANRVIDRAEESDALNRMLLGSEEDPDRRQRRLADLLRGLMVAAAVWAAVFVLRRVWRARLPTDQPRPPAVAGAPRPGPPGVFDRREYELLRRNNLYEPVRDLLRDFFAAAGAPPGGRRPPPVQFGEAARKPARLQKTIEDLWRVAYGKPTTVTVHQWEELGPRFDALRLAFEDGAWRFETAAATGEG